MLTVENKRRLDTWIIKVLRKIRVFKFIFFNGELWIKELKELEKQLLLHKFVKEIQLR